MSVAKDLTTTQGLVKLFQVKSWAFSTDICFQEIWVILEGTCFPTLGRHSCTQGIQNFLKINGGPVYGYSGGSSYSLTLRTDERVVTWFVIWEEEDLTVEDCVDPLRIAWHTAIQTYWKKFRELGLRVASIFGSCDQFSSGIGFPSTTNNFLKLLENAKEKQSASMRG